jgi:hypothetical protein
MHKEIVALMKPKIVTVFPRIHMVLHTHNPIIFIFSALDTSQVTAAIQNLSTLCNTVGRPAFM